MNERIKELVDQCYEKSDMFDNGLFFDKEKFAELIVKECLSICVTAVGNADYNTGRMHCHSNIKEHFGVDA